MERVSAGSGTGSHGPHGAFAANRYDIQFSNSGSRLRALLQTVARGPGSPYYFFAPDTDTLRQVFRRIADHLSRLRLSK